MLHIIRPTGINHSEYTYIGPLAAIACVQKKILKYSSRDQLESMSIATDGGQEALLGGAVFELV